MTEFIDVDWPHWFWITDDALHDYGVFESATFVRDASGAYVSRHEVEIPCLRVLEERGGNALTLLLDDGQQADFAYHSITYWDDDWNPAPHLWLDNPLRIRQPSTMPIAGFARPRELAAFNEEDAHSVAEAVRSCLPGLPLGYRLEDLDVIDVAEGPVVAVEASGEVDIHPTHFCAEDVRVVGLRTIPGVTLTAAFELRCELGMAPYGSDFGSASPRCTPVALDLRLDSARSLLQQVTADFPTKLRAEVLDACEKAVARAVRPFASLEAHVAAELQALVAVADEVCHRKSANELPSRTYLLEAAKHDVQYASNHDCLPVALRHQTTMSEMLALADSCEEG